MRPHQPGGTSPSPPSAALQITAIATRPLFRFHSVSLHVAEKTEKRRLQKKPSLTRVAWLSSRAKHAPLAGRGRGGAVRDVCTAALLFALPAPELVYVSWAVVHQIALRGGGPSQMFSTQGELQEATAFGTAARQLSAQPSPSAAFSAALRGGCFPEPLFGLRTKGNQDRQPTADGLGLSR